jgi:hypothetical protein
VGEYTSITVGVDGVPVISYLDDFNKLLKMARCLDPLCALSIRFDLGDTSPGRYSSMAIGADGLPVMSHSALVPAGFGSFTALSVVHCWRPDCRFIQNGFDFSRGTVYRVDGSPSEDVGEYTSVAIGDDGLPFISYYDATNHDLKVAHCSDVMCSEAVTRTLDSADDVGKYTSMTIGVDGMPLIAYYDATNGDLKVVHCSNVFCIPYVRWD